MRSRLARFRRTIIVAMAIVTAGLTFGSAACGTEAVGVDSCRQIEKARCENAQSCGISLAEPVHRGDSPESNVLGCTRYYDDACLHGLVAATDPGKVAVQACVDAINTGDCNVVKTPELSPACSFLKPAADAGTD